VRRPPLELGTIERVIAAVAVVLVVIVLWNVYRLVLEVPDVVRDRSVLPSCGQETRMQTPEDPSAVRGRNDEGRRCLWNAYLAKRAAEFTSTRSTVEGDPIPTIYRVLAGGTIEAFVDRRRDRYSRGGWVRLECLGLRLEEGWSGPELVLGLDDNDCTVTPLP
jgi:hypothetical protein